MFGGYVHRRLAPLRTIVCGFVKIGGLCKKEYHGQNLSGYTRMVCTYALKVCGYTREICGYAKMGSVFRWLCLVVGWLHPVMGWLRR